MAPIDGTCADWAAFLGRARSMGPFMTNQVVTDMKYTRYLGAASDCGTFVLAGPGTQRGLNRLHGLDLGHAWRQEDASAALAELRAVVARAAPEFVDALRDLNTISNVCCETDKYLRVLLGEGKPRARYVQQKDESF